MNVADLVHLADVSAVMRGNGIHRAKFNPDGSLAECELEPKFTPPEAPRKPLTPEEQELAKRADAEQARAAKLAYDRMLFAASEGDPDAAYPNDGMGNT